MTTDRRLVATILTATAALAIFHAHSVDSVDRMRAPMARCVQALTCPPSELDRYPGHTDPTRTADLASDLARVRGETP